MGPGQMGADLAVFLEASAGLRVAWGRHDCLLWPADWAWRLTGKDPAAAWRGRYRTAIGAQRIVRREGGMAAVATAGMAAIGALAIDPDDARPGDVGLVTRPVRGSRGLAPGLVGAIRSGGGWSVLSDRGLWEAPGGAARAWRLGYG